MHHLKVRHGSAGSIGPDGVVNAFKHRNPGTYHCGAEALARAEFLSLRSSLYKDLGRFEAAARDLQTAYRVSRKLADSHSQGRAGIVTTPWQGAS